MTDRPAGWRYLELTYDPRDRVRVRLDGVARDDDAPLGEVVRRLGIDGWEMVGSAAADDTRQVLWFRRPIDATVPAQDVPTPAALRRRRRPQPPGSGEARARVTLVGLGRGRSDPHQRRLVIDAVAALTGESGWRATRIVDKAPRVVVDGVTPDEAERIRQTLEALGATVEVG